MQIGNFPGLYRSADQLSLQAQRRFYIVLFGHLTVLVVAAVVSVINSPLWQLAMFQASLLLGALGFSIYLAAVRPDRAWYAARAVAESIKTMTWRYVSRAEPFDGEIATARDHFLKSLGAVVVQNREVAQQLTEYLGDDQITKEMDSMRSAELLSRVDIYKNCRIKEQLNWYAKKARFNRNASKVFFALLISVNIIGVVFALGKIRYPAASYWPTDVFVALSACLLTWMQAKRFSELAASYALAAHEIGLIDTASVTSEKSFSDFVGDTENAFSREHTQWTARKDVFA
jgi:ABC-type multidrug transport system fused ATPase/permease subunit